MKILSWNIWSENKSFGMVIRYIRKEKPDVVCLQEVSAIMLRKLKKISGYECVVATDFYFFKSNRKTRFYLVILSKLPILQHQHFPLETKRHVTLVSQIFLHEESIEAHYVDVDYKGSVIRVSNTHLPSFTSPSVRLEHVKAIISKRDPLLPYVLCGDFNTFGLWHINFMVGLFYNYAWEEFLADEQLLFYDTLKKFKLTSVLKGTTHPWLGLQLDHIIIQKGIRAIKKKIFKDTFGSDHQPLFAKISLPKVRVAAALTLAGIRLPKTQGAKKTKPQRALRNR